jgi:5-methylcytosine-specific restriction endonuclease McrA
LARHGDRLRETINRWKRESAIKHQYNAKRRARLASATVGDVDIKALRAEWDGICGICRVEVVNGEPVEIDHIIPLARGGAHGQRNLQLAHRLCNRRKKDKLAA